MPGFNGPIAGVVVGALVLAGAGCHSGQAPLRGSEAQDGGLLVPGSPLLTPPPLTDTAVHLVVYVKRGSGDTAEKKWRTRAASSMPCAAGVTTSS